MIAEMMGLTNLRHQQHSSLKKHQHLAYDSTVYRLQCA